MNRLKIKTKIFLNEYLSRQRIATTRHELARHIVSIGFEKYQLAEIYNLGPEYEDLNVLLGVLSEYVHGKKVLRIDEVQLVLARFARELMCSDLEPDMIHQINDDAWAVIETLDYVSAMEDVL